MGGCVFHDGKDGEIYGNFHYDTTIASMDLTGLGIAVAGTLPDMETRYPLSPGHWKISWTTAGALTFETWVELEVNEGEEAKNYGMRTSKYETGEHGKNKLIIFNFSNDIMRAQEILDTLPGVPYF